MVPLLRVQMEHVMASLVINHSKFPSGPKSIYTTAAPINFEMQGLVVTLKIVPEEFASNIEWIVTYSAKEAEL